MKTTEQTRITGPQKAVFRIMELASFNNFDGPMVVKSLQQNRHLWKGAIFGLFDVPGAYGITLRDIENGSYNADTLLLKPAEGEAAQAALKELARTWSADEVDWEAVPHVNGLVLRVWWD